MLWIVALAAAAVVGSIARHAWQDHRDAELQRRDALDDVARPRTWRKQRALPTGERLRLSAGSDSERSSEVGNERPAAGETRTGEAPSAPRTPAPPVAPPAAPRAASEPRKPTPPLDARML